MQKLTELKDNNIFHTFKRKFNMYFDKDDYMIKLQSIFINIESDNINEYLWHFYHNSPFDFIPPKCHCGKFCIWHKDQKYQKTCGSKKCYNEIRCRIIEGNCFDKLNKFKKYDKFNVFMQLLKKNVSKKEYIEIIEHLKNEYKELSKESKIDKEILWHFWNNSPKNFSKPKCPHCDKKRKYHQNGIYRDTCGSKECKRKEIESTYYKIHGKYHNWCSGTESRKKHEETMEELYGNKNYFATEEGKERIAEIMKEKYGGTGNASPIILKKIRKTNIENGIWLKPEQRTEFEQYKFEVWQITNKELKQWASYKWGEDWESKRGHGPDDYQVDHVYSILQGFNDGIPPDVIGSFQNLQFIPAYENMSKGTDCRMTKEELKEKSFQLIY